MIKLIADAPFSFPAYKPKIEPKELIVTAAGTSITLLNSDSSNESFSKTRKTSIIGMKNIKDINSKMQPPKSINSSQDAKNQ